MFKPSRSKQPQDAEGEPRLGLRRAQNAGSPAARMFLVAAASEEGDAGSPPALDRSDKRLERGNRSESSPSSPSNPSASLARPLAAAPRFGLGRRAASGAAGKGELGATRLQAALQPLVMPGETAQSPRQDAPRGRRTAHADAVTEMPAQRRVVNDADAPRAIAIPSRIMAIAGDTCAGLLLSQILYWTRRGALTAQNEGWIFKTSAEWEQETGMSWKVQHRARAALVARGLIEERRLSMPSRLEFRLKLSVLASELGPYSDLELGELTLPVFLDLPGEAVDRLVGRAFLFHSLFTRIWPVPTAMLCSRLVAGVKLNLFALSARDAQMSAWSGTTRLIRLHRQSWQADTGLTRDQWQTARRNLAGAGVLIERRHNFPRRVDLGIDLAALAHALRAGPAVLPKGSPNPTFSDRPIPPTGSPDSTFSDRPNQPTESPDPAFSDRPIPPLSVAQSHLYPVLDEGRQPPRHPAHAPEGSQSALDSTWGGWGSKGYASQKTAVSPMAMRLPAPPGVGQGDPARLVAPVALAALVWPSLFSDEDKAHAGRHLAGLDRSIQQQLLDEIEWQHAHGKAIRSPVALTRALARKVNEGTFAADGAHRIAAARRQRAEEATELAAKASRRAAEEEARAAGHTSGEAAQAQDTRSPEVLARLAKILGKPVGRKSA